jgi:hypothetical protein
VGRGLAVLAVIEDGHRHAHRDVTQQTGLGEVPVRAISSHLRLGQCGALTWLGLSCSQLPAVLLGSGIQLASPEPECAGGSAADGLALERLVEQLPAAQAMALRLTILEGLSLRASAAHLQISPMAVQRAQKKAIAALRQQLSGGG